ncbi:YiiD C-terminal domain-containing protein [Burkholderia contaminans]|uniref:YiiD C-terminal domain-containing protein n=1 Tax=Burkholderia contaminans TaxID=488447 RepID=UPI00128BDA1A|nr:YiiD C-terminal domain-containing protein [Burkholderia contaminans]MEB4642338.1 YiiD C-terminal domain-containing protein [Burkholderia contaminans]MEB4657361.1 YiiD C-terminal domain-containing protein [Burkholderia contaminans]MEB4672667.1 YiiD C-terminal domain-containing protein [Burkholderia contaminans]MEB4684945.1 YiiD C-terminal domain-containing protein [Burkholderia contaminans]MEB4691126.1 YiiD C-terminal domain-containing protein [Burkholderia contaminans]
MHPTHTRNSQKMTRSTNVRDIEKYLIKAMPMTESLGFSVRSFSEVQVEISAPLDRNINHCGTAFGGSISVLAILSAWCLVWANVREESPGGNVIICSHSIKFKNAIFSDIRSISESGNLDWNNFRRRVARRGSAKIDVTSRIYSNEIEAATFSGSFAFVNAIEVFIFSRNRQSDPPRFAIDGGKRARVAMSNNDSAGPGLIGSLRDT